MNYKLVIIIEAKQVFEFRRLKFVTSLTFLISFYFHMKFFANN